MSYLPTTSTSGTYTPTVSNTTNLDSTTPSAVAYGRTGSVVTVFGKITVDPTSSGTSTSMELSLPIASDLGAAGDVMGFFAVSGSFTGGTILGDAGTNLAQFVWISTTTTSTDYFFTFSYRII